MSPTCEALLAKARESLQAAVVLKREGFPDICASRCYYAMFYATEAILSSKNLAFSSHSATNAAFGREFVKTGLVEVEFHQYLLRAFETRQESDYEAAPTVSAERAAEMVAQAQEFIEMAARFLQPRQGSPKTAQ